MNVSGGNGIALAKAMNDLILHWDESSVAWRDKAREDFDKTYLQELIHATRQASNAVQQIEEFMRQVRKECS